MSIMSRATFYFYSGLAAATYSVVAALAYYSYSGPQLIEPSVAKQMIKGGALVIDVRTSTEYKTGHFPGAVNIPVGKISTVKLPNIARSRDIVVYCNTGQRARLAAERLKTRGYTRVYYIAGTYSSLK